MTKRPSPTGEYAVGTFTYTVYTDRKEALEPGTKRKVPARVYYPVLKESVKDLPKAKYMTENMAKGLKKSMHVPVNFKKAEAEGDNISECYENAPKIEGQKFPLIMFNHGLLSFRERNSFLCIELASQGYVVISVGHPYDAVCTEFDDGTHVFAMKGIQNKQYEPMLGGFFNAYKLIKYNGDNRELAEKFEELQQNYCAFVRSRITEWEKDTMNAIKYAKENLSDMIDYSKGIAACGHSLGGAASYALCFDEPEIVCGINIDGAPFGENRGRIQEKPFLQISCKGNLKAETRVFIDHKAPAYSVVFRDMAHVGFSDMKHMIKFNSLTGKLDADLMHENLCKCFSEFFDAYLKKAKEKPAIQSNDVITVTEYAPDTK